MHQVATPLFTLKPQHRLQFSLPVFFLFISDPLYGLHPNSAHSLRQLNRWLFARRPVR